MAFYKIISAAFVIILITIFGTFFIQSRPNYKVTQCPLSFGENQKNIECGILSVLQDDYNVFGQRLAIPIIIVKAKTPKENLAPVIYIHGGPGGGVLEDLPKKLNSPMGKELIAQDQDWIFFDQRGTGLSFPKLDCGNIALNDAGPQSMEVVGNLQNCAEKLKTGGIKFENYNSQYVIKDIKSLNSVLGIRKFNLYGNSYGTRIAMRAADEKLTGLQAILLDSPWPPEASWTAYGPKWVSEAVKLVLENCEIQEKCANQHRGLQTRFYNFMNEIVQNPITKNANSYDAKLISQYLMDGLYDGEMVAKMPNDLENIINGDYSKLDEYKKNNGANYDEAHHIAFLCNEELPFEDPKISLENSKDDPIAMAVAQTMVLYFKTCSSFNNAKPKIVENSAVKSDIPALFMAAGIDPGCPASLSINAVKDFSKGQILIMPFSTHQLAVNSECARNVARKFLTSPNEKLDLSCAKSEKEKIDFYDAE